MLKSVYFTRQFFFSLLLSVIVSCSAAVGQTPVGSLPQLQGPPAATDLFVLDHVAAPPGQRTSTVTAQNLAAFVYAAWGLGLQNAVQAAQATANAALPHVPTLAALRTYAGPSAVVRRDGFYAPGDGGAAVYALSATACSAADNGAQVPAASGGCWIADMPSPATTNIWGSLADSIGISGFGTDDTAAEQAAINWSVATGRSITRPAAAGGLKRRVTSPLLVKGHSFQTGDGCAPYTATNAFSPFGSILFFDHPGQGIVVGSSNGPVEAVRLEHFCTFRAQPVPPPNNADGTPGGTWTPGNFDYDIVEQQDDLTLNDVALVDPTKGILQQSGRIKLTDVVGNPYTNGLTITSALDTPYVHDLHWWPYSIQNAAVNVYIAQNLDALYLMRADNMRLSNYSAINSKYCIHIGQNTGGSPATNGTVSRLAGVNIDCDGYGASGLYVDPTVTVGATAMLTNFTTQGFGNYYGGTSPAKGVNGIDIEGTGSFSVTQFLSTVSQGSGVNIGSSTASLNLLFPSIASFGQDGVTKAAISVAAGSSVQIAGQPQIGAGGAPGYTSFGGAGTITTGAPLDALGRVIAQGVNASPSPGPNPLLLLAQGGTIALKTGAGIVSIEDQGTAQTALCFITGGGTAIIAQSGSEFVALNPGDTSANAVGRTGSGKIGVYYDTGTGAYSIANNTGSTLSFGYGQIVTRAAN